MISRSQRRTATRLCTRHLRDGGTARRVWGSHLGGHPTTDSTSEHATDDRRRRAPAKRTKSQKPLGGGGLSLDNGSPHKGSALTPPAQPANGEELLSVAGFLRSHTGSSSLEGRVVCGLCQGFDLE
jgi:hypothetical protein